jgi:hypothetical protein
MDEGRERHPVSVSWTILGPNVVQQPVFVARDREHPEEVLLTLSQDDAITYRGSKVSH